MTRAIHTLTLSVFVVFLFSFSVLFWILPDQAFSEQENRSLRTLPAFSARRLASGEYACEINDYFADQFPLRNTFVGWKGAAEIVLGKGENNGILLGRGGQLGRRLFDIMGSQGETVRDLDIPDPRHLEGAIEGIVRTDAALSVPFTVLLTGRSVDVAAEAFFYPSIYSDRMLQLLREGLSRKVTYLDTVPMYRERYGAGEYVYYRTDHHWTTLGAYYAYVEIMKSYGMEGEVIPMEAFARQKVSDSFFGTSWSAGGMKLVPPDRVEIWMLGNEGEFSVTADGRELGSFYSMERLLEKDHYSVFLDGTHDVVTIKKRTEEERPTLLLFKDSFANPVAPFLAQHFDLVLLNLSSTRTDYTDVTAYTERYGADAVLLIYTLENVMTTNKMNDLQ